MITRKIAVFLFASLGIALTSCGQSASSSKPAQSQTESVNPTSSESSVSASSESVVSSDSASSPDSSSAAPSVSTIDPNTVDGDPTPTYLPTQAPKDYEGVNPSDVDDPYLAYAYADHRMANVDYYSKTSGTATALGFTQNVAGIKIYIGTSGLTQSVTLSDGNVQGITVSKAEQRFEDVNEGIYEGRQGIDGTYDIDESGNGSVKEWDNVDNYSNRTGFLEAFGHDVFGITNYDVRSQDAILSGQIALNDANKHVFHIDFNPTVAGKYYAIEQAHMINLGNAEVQIESLSADIAVDDEWNVTQVAVTEAYTATIFGGVTISLSSSFVTDFTVLPNGLDSMDDANVKSVYLNAADAFKA